MCVCPLNIIIIIYILLLYDSYITRTSDLSSYNATETNMRGIQKRGSCYGNHVDARTYTNMDAGMCWHIVTNALFRRVANGSVSILVVCHRLGLRNVFLIVSARTARRISQRTLSISLVNQTVETVSGRAMTALLPQVKSTSPHERLDSFVIMTTIARRIDSYVTYRSIIHASDVI